MLHYKPVITRVLCETAFIMNV